MVKKVAEACLKNLETAWSPVEKITTVLVRSEVNPQFATIVQPSDLVIVTKFEVELEQSAGTLILCIPYAMLEPIRSKLSTGFQAETMDIDYAWQNRLKEIIKESEVNISILVGTTQITGESLINMKTGDVIQLDQGIDKPLVGMIEGYPKMLGTAGVQRGLQSFKLDKKIIVE
jgi:flagellar motor switch protein FliM